MDDQQSFGLVSQATEETVSTRPVWQPPSHASPEQAVSSSNCLPPADDDPLTSVVRQSPPTKDIPTSFGRDDLVYYPHEYAEDLEFYCLGGFHPVHIGDEYSDGRYIIVNKVNYGGYSTVWLAKDQHANHYVVLKIMVADAATGKDSAESRILHLLRDAQTKDPHSSYVLEILDDFYIDGPNGCHLCVASEAAIGCGVGAFKDEESNLYPLNMARVIAAQVILGVKQIHSCGVVHGDLHPMNFLFRSPPLDSLSTEEMYERFGEPRKYAVKRFDGAALGKEAPQYIPDLHPLANPDDRLEEPHILICDFGEAWLSNTETRDYLRTPELYRAPEAYFSKEHIGKPADIWALGCVLFEILGNKRLYQGGHFIYDRDSIISVMVSALGMLPKFWWEQWDGKSKYFHDDGSWNTCLEYVYGKSEPLLQRIQEFGRKDDPEFTAEEATSFANMLSAMFIYDPEKRATIEEVVELDWMKRWGLPALAQRDQQAQELESHMGLFVVGEACIFE